MAKLRRQKKTGLPSPSWVKRLHNVSAELRRGKTLSQDSLDKLVYIAWQMILARDCANTEFSSQNAISSAQEFFTSPRFEQSHRDPDVCLLRDWSKAKFSFAQTGLKSINFARVLIVSFSGEAGNSHRASGTFRFMDAIIAAGKAAWRPDALLLDLRKLKYKWGDEMANTLGEAAGTSGGQALPIAILSSALNRRGLTSLIVDEMGGDPRRWLFASTKQALAFLDRTCLDQRRNFASNAR